MLLVVIIIFCIDLWGFSIDPLILVMTLQNRKTLFCAFWCFRDLPELKLTWDFSSVNILSWEPSGVQEVNEGGYKAHLSTGGAGPRLGRATHARLILGPPMPSIFVSGSSAWPKNDYIKTPKAFPWWGSGETWNTKIEAIPAKIWGGNVAKSYPIASPTSPTSRPSTPPWRGSSPPLDYGFWQ
jgi:hypothetical protein